ncbi:hypothetical protein B1A87_007005 [Arthrobacter sp. KBS0703]|uniref:sensor histidine kinase n=1 Tax=Arthrobacter sp. KBS0703 TaxID=1955698 RepID=UPI001184E512|nr:ATP-binding protein [Arthrobacter sp. KBS0703]TSE15687.1 hypothetical protein B1A87_007005 [Arthrobacter sp. KBS0703]
MHVQIPAGPSAQATHRLMGQGISAVALLLLLQALGLIIGQRQWTETWWEAVFLWAFLAVFVWFVAASVRGSFLRTTGVILIALVLAGLTLWPVAVPPAVPAGIGTPWLWAVINVGAAWCTFTAGTAAGCVYSVVIGAVLGVVRTTAQVGSVGTIMLAWEDTLFATILAVIICLTIGILRQTAARVDEAADEAIRQYREAASAAAVSNERLRLDGLLHDSVMAALITAANAHSDYEYAASSRLASRARGRLGLFDAVAVERPPATVAELAARIRFTVEDRAGAPEVAVTCNSPQNVMLPAPVVSAVFEATTEAVKNARRHSGATRCEVNVIGRSLMNANRVVVKIKDNGVGFDQALVSDRRLGVRVSIIGRLNAVGGAGKVTSTSGSGTEVDLEWEGATS